MCCIYRNDGKKIFLRRGRGWLNACFKGRESRWNMTGKEIENIIYAIGLIGWIPILAIFSSIAKVIVAFKGNYTGGNGVNIDIKHNSDDCDEEDE